MLKQGKRQITLLSLFLDVLDKPTRLRVVVVARSAFIVNGNLLSATACLR